MDRPEPLDLCLEPLVRQEDEFEVLVTDQDTAPAAIPDDSRLCRLADLGSGLSRDRTALSEFGQVFALRSYPYSSVVALETAFIPGITK
jgi:hypothetical protein